MARPKKTESAVLTHRLAVRLSDTQYEIVRLYANQMGMSMAEYIRHQAVHGKVNIDYQVVASIPDLQNLTNEFGKIGNNLNQIARYFNTGGLQSKAMREEINSCIAQIMQMRKAVMEMAGDFHGNPQAPVE